ncbi:hypothetical protein [Persephonella sp.]|uniref:hypothetical protein n=1 Tax=Persephonella sp. TaxID=2060922 RepID=UPI0025E45D53|nr:hypothetical protein [Persephonella sp.]
MAVSLESGRRYSGEIKIKRFCHKFGIDMDFSLVFSGVVDNAGVDQFLLHSINPSQMIKIFKDNSSFYLFINKNTTAYNLQAVVKEVSEGKVLFQVEEQSVSEEKRRFHRFYFCCKDLGDFIIQKEGKTVCDNVCIFELSRSGLGLINPCVGLLKVGDTVVIKNEEQNFEVEFEVHRISKKKGYEFMGGKVKKANINLINYIIRKYIKVSEEIINKTG